MANRPLRSDRELKDRVGEAFTLNDLGVVYNTMRAR